MVVAAMIGVSSVSLISYWNPAPIRASSADLVERASLRNLLLSVVSSEGVPWLQVAPAGQICSSVSSLSNSSVTVSATVDGFRCGLSPPAGAQSANLTLTFESRTVVLQAWKGGAQ